MYFTNGQAFTDRRETEYITSRIKQGRRENEIKIIQKEARKERKRIILQWDKQKGQNEMVKINLNTSLIIININSLNNPILKIQISRLEVGGWISKKTQDYRSVFFVLLL